MGALLTLNTINRYVKNENLILIASKNKTGHLQLKCRKNNFLTFLIVKIFNPNNFRLSTVVKLIQEQEEKIQATFIFNSQSLEAFYKKLNGKIEKHNRKPGYSYLVPFEIFRASAHPRISENLDPCRFPTLYPDEATKFLYDPLENDSFPDCLSAFSTFEDPLTSDHAENKLESALNSEVLKNEYALNEDEADISRIPIPPPIENFLKYKPQRPLPPESLLERFQRDFPEIPSQDENHLVNEAREILQFLYTRLPTEKIIHLRKFYSCGQINDSFINWLKHERNNWEDSQLDLLTRECEFLLTKRFALYHTISKRDLLFFKLSDLASSSSIK